MMRYSVDPANRCSQDHQREWIDERVAETYDDARDRDEREDEGHVCFRPRERVVFAECGCRISTTEDCSKEQPLK